MLVDVSAARLAPVVGISGRSVHLTLATAWPMLLLHTRPLSNTYESILFALLLVLFLAPPGREDEERMFLFYTESTTCIRDRPKLGDQAYAPG